MRRIAICRGSVAAFLLLAIGLVSAFGAMLRPAAAAKAEAALPPLTISVLVSSRDDRCYDTGFVEAIKHLSNV